MEIFSGIIYLGCMCSVVTAIALMLNDIFDDIEAKEQMEWNSSKQSTKR